MDKGWENSVAHQLGIQQLEYKQLEGGRVCVLLSCHACPKTMEVYFGRRYPPEVFKKKLQERGWDTRPGKIRCISCFKANRKAHRAKFDNTPSNQVQIIKEASMRHPRVANSETLTTIVIPCDNDLYDMFVSNGHARAHWSYTFITDPKTNEKQLLVKKEEVKGDRVPGFSKGSVNKKSKDFTAQISKSKIEGSENIKIFSPSTSTVIKKTNDYVILSLPEAATDKPTTNQYKPVSPAEVRSSIPEKVKAVQVKEEPKIVDKPDPTPVKEEVKSSVEMMKTVSVPKTNIIFDKDTIGIYHAIEVLNMYKSVMGDKLVFNVNEAGMLNALAQFGPE